MPLQVRIIRRRLAAQRVRSFFGVFGKMSVAIIAGMFYGAVKRSQALVRGFFQCRRARVGALTLLLQREVNARRSTAIAAEKDAAEQRIALLSPGIRRRSTLQEELQLIYAQYDKTHANVLDILGLAEEGVLGIDGSTAMEEHTQRSALVAIAEAFLQ